MKAAVLTEFGGPEVLKVQDMPRPQAEVDELLIKVEAAGINRLDHYIREGGVNPDLAFPFILGSDAVGTAVAKGCAVDDFELGDRVIPMPGYPLCSDDDQEPVLSAAASYAIRGLLAHGSYAEYMTIPARWALKERSGLPAVELATLPMPLITAVRAVKTVGAVSTGMHVLIHAGASGTGSMMIQVAKALGAKVATTLRSAEKAEFVRDLGAELVLTADMYEAAEQLKAWSAGGVDVVVDNLGGPSLARSLEMTKPLGVVVLMGNVLGLESSISVRSVFFPQRQIRGTLMGDRDDLQWGLDQVAKGYIRPTLDRTFPLEQAAEAHALLAQGDVAGNLVFDLG